MSTDEIKVMQVFRCICQHCDWVVMGRSASLAEDMARGHIGYGWGGGAGAGYEPNRGHVVHIETVTAVGRQP